MLIESLFRNYNKKLKIYNNDMEALKNSEDFTPDVEAMYYFSLCTDEDYSILKTMKHGTTSELLKECFEEILIKEIIKNGKREDIETCKSALQILSNLENDYPYLVKLSYNNVYNPNYGDNRICVCGHTYSRHFDFFDDADELSYISCKYCGCESFVEAKITENN